MSRVGKVPVSIPENVKIEINNLSVKVEGPKGSLDNEFAGNISILQQEGAIVVKPSDDQKRTRAMWGTARSIINNMILGVTHGFKEELEVNGVGYKAAVKGKYLSMSLGKSHNTMIEIPEEVKAVTPKQDIIQLEATDKEKLGQFVAVIKSQRPPEPYKGKGIKRKGEFVIRKEGKKS